MDEILHANIFFVIASLATVVFCILVSLILYHVLKLVRALQRVVERIEAESEKIADDFATVRSYVANAGIISRLIGFIMPRSGRSRRRRSKQTDEYDV